MIVCPDSNVTAVITHTDIFICLPMPSVYIWVDVPEKRKAVRIASRIHGCLGREKRAGNNSECIFERLDGQYFLYVSDFIPCFGEFRS